MTRQSTPAFTMEDDMLEIGYDETGTRATLAGQPLSRPDAYALNAYLLRQKGLTYARIGEELGQLDHPKEPRKPRTVSVQVGIGERLYKRFHEGYWWEVVCSRAVRGIRRERGQTWGFVGEPLMVSFRELWEATVLWRYGVEPTPDNVGPKTVRDVCHWLGIEAPAQDQERAMARALSLGWEGWGLDALLASSAGQNPYLQALLIWKAEAVGLKVSQAQAILRECRATTGSHLGLRLDRIQPLFAVSRCIEDMREEAEAALDELWAHIASRPFGLKLVGD